jgi:exonuclease III
MSSEGSISIGCWNAWSFCERAEMIVDQMDLDVTCIPSTWHKEGQTWGRGYYPSDPGPGVAIRLSKRLQGGVISRIMIQEQRERLVALRLKGGGEYNVVVVAAYFPPGNSRKEKKIRQDLHKEIRRIYGTESNHNCFVVLGDLNARMASDSDGANEGKIVGKHIANAVEDYRGKLLRETCKALNLRDCGSWTQERRNKSKATWKSWNGEFNTTVDYILVPALFIRRKLKWLGNLLYAEVDTPSRDVVAKMPEMVEKWFFGLSVEEAREKSANFIEWDAFIDECVAKHGLTSGKINAEKKKKENE